MNANAIIAQHLKLATEVAIKETERLARKTMRDNPEIVCFIMAMGRCVFYIDEPGVAGVLPDEDPRIQEVTDFVYQWNSNLRLTGHPMRINGATGKLLSDW